MKKHFQVLSCLLLIAISGLGQNKDKEIYNALFKWTIRIPESFEAVSAEQWEKMQNRGQEAIEATYDQKMPNLAKTIFVFKSDQLNYFESNYQPFDVAVDGNYAASCQSSNKILFETFRSQLPDVKVDSATSKEVIGGLEFRKFYLKVQYPNRLVLHAYLYSRLFDKKEFSVNIMYAEEAKGALMLKAWKNSTFK